MASTRWLSEIEIEKLIQCHADSETKQAFLGVFAVNTLPKQVHHLPLLLIVNTDASNLPGRHWKVAYISEEKQGEIFDSLVTPVNILLEQWMNKFSNKWIMSSKTIQHPLSPSCGAYALHFVLSRLHCKDLQSYVNQFSTILHENEVFIQKFMESISFPTKKAVIKTHRNRR